MNTQYKQYCMLLAWLIALAATLTTLYSSEGLHMPVCHLCWFQRICIYPLVIILGIGAFQNDPRASIYAIPMSIIGGLFALYQYLEQMIPGFSPIQFCTANLSCSTTHIRFFGFITYPFLSFMACLMITLLLIPCLKGSKYRTLSSAE